MLALVLSLCVAACGSAPTHQPLAGKAAASATSPSPAASMRSQPSVAVAPSPSPPPLAAPPRPAPLSAYRPLGFTGLAAGVYVTHLHSICDGRQAFHITVLQDLIVRSGGAGTISVPSEYFGRGLCVIVYANATLTRVLTTRRI
jgi:hypothetical protein